MPRSSDRSLAERLRSTRTFLSSRRNVVLASTFDLRAHNRVFAAARTRSSGTRSATFPGLRSSIDLKSTSTGRSPSSPVSVFSTAILAFGFSSASTASKLFLLTETLVRSPSAKVFCPLLCHPSTAVSVAAQPSSMPRRYAGPA